MILDWNPNTPTSINYPIDPSNGQVIEYHHPTADGVGITSPSYYHHSFPTHLPYSAEHPHTPDSDPSPTSVDFQIGCGRYLAEELFVEEYDPRVYQPLLAIQEGVAIGPPYFSHGIGFQGLGHGHGHSLSLSSFEYMPPSLPPSLITHRRAPPPPLHHSASFTFGSSSSSEALRVPQVDPFVGTGGFVGMTPTPNTTSFEAAGQRVLGVPVSAERDVNMQDEQGGSEEEVVKGLGLSDLTAAVEAEERRRKEEEAEEEEEEDGGKTPNPGHMEEGEGREREVTPGNTGRVIDINNQERPSSASAVSGPGTEALQSGRLNYMVPTTPRSGISPTQASRLQHGRSASFAGSPSGLRNPPAPLAAQYLVTQPRQGIRQGASGYPVAGGRSGSHGDIQYAYAPQYGDMRYPSSPVGNIAIPSLYIRSPDRNGFPQQQPMGVPAGYTVQPVYAMSPTQANFFANGPFVNPHEFGGQGGPAGHYGPGGMQAYPPQIFQQQHQMPPPQYPTNVFAYQYPSNGSEMDEHSQSQLNSPRYSQFSQTQIRSREPSLGSKASLESMVSSTTGSFMSEEATGGPGGAGRGLASSAPMERMMGFREEHGERPEAERNEEGQVITFTTNADEKQTATVKRECYTCSSRDPPSWRKSTLDPKNILCNRCGIFERSHGFARNDETMAMMKAREKPRGGKRNRPNGPLIRRPDSLEPGLMGSHMMREQYSDEDMIRNMRPGHERMNSAGSLADHSRRASIASQDSSYYTQNNSSASSFSPSTPHSNQMSPRGGFLNQKRHAELPGSYPLAQYQSTGRHGGQPYSFARAQARRVSLSMAPGEDMGQFVAPSPPRNNIRMINPPRGIPWTGNNSFGLDRRHSVQVLNGPEASGSGGMYEERR